MVLRNFVNDIIVPNEHPGKAFDNAGYEKALKESGYTAEDAKKYWDDLNNAEPYARAGKELNSALDAQVPKVIIENNGITIAAPKALLDSPLVAQIEKQLQSLKGSDLSSPEVANAIDALNKEVRENISNTMIKETFGWTPEEFSDYQYAIQTVNVKNPMASTNKIKGKDRDGNVVMKTPQEWIDYYRQAYNTDERTDAFLASLESDNPYERTMALVMSKGKETPTYGFDTGERLGQLFGRAWSSFKELPEGVVNKLVLGNDAKRVDDLATRLNLDMSDILPKTRYLNEEDDKQAYENSKAEIKDKSWNDLTNEQKGFLLKVAVSREDGSVRAVDRDIRRTFEEHSNGRTPVIDIDNMSSENESVSKDAINRILSDSTYDRYKDVSHNYDQLAYSDLSRQRELERFSKNAIWSGTEQQIGAFAGTLWRFWLENAVINGLTGFNMNSISDTLGGKLVNVFSKFGISPASKYGQGFVKFIANLAGTIPEDIIQTTVDSFLTDNEEELKQALTGEGISDNLKTNFIFMALFNGAKTGLSAIKRARIAKKLKNIADLDQEFKFAENAEAINDNLADAIKAIKNGGSVEVSDGKVYAVNADGSRVELSNLTVEQANLLNRMSVDEIGNIRTSVDSTNISRIGSDVAANLDTSPATVRSLDEVVKERDTTVGRLETLNKQRNSWIENGYKDENGNDVRIMERDSNGNEVRGTSRMEKLEADIDNTKKKISSLEQEIDEINNPKKTKYQEAVEEVRKNADGDTTTVRTEEGSDGRVKVEVDTPNGKVISDSPDYKIDTFDDAVNSKIKVESTPASVKLWHTRALNAVMKGLRSSLKEFKARFGDVKASDFDWVWYNTKKGLTPDKIIGTVDPTTGRRVTQNTIDAIKWWGEQPFVKELRMSSRKSLGLDGDLNVLGYLPHTSFDPSNLSYDEALTGMLWKKASGKSVVGDNGDYVGFGGNLENRYRTFASNMLWDARAKEVAAAKLMEEAQLDGNTKVTEAQAVKATDGAKKMQQDVNSSPSTKKLKDAMKSDGDYDKKVYEEAAEGAKKDAQSVGLGKAVHDNYKDIYVGANKAAVQSQPGATGFKKSFSSQSDTLRDIVTKDGSMYDNGAADIVYASQNASEIVNRFMREGGDFRQMLIDFIESHSHRSEKYAEAVADRWIAKLNDGNGTLTKGKAILSLSGSMQSEGMSRLRRWIVRSEYKAFNRSTKNFIDDFLFRHMQMESIKNDPTITQKITKALDGLTGLRYRALFYGNIKNALLQVSELSRLFVTFKWGDVGTMLKRLATDADFRAKVDMYVDAVAPETSFLDSELYGKYKNLADNMEVSDDGVTFKKLKDNIKETADAIGLAPINKAEALKNRTMVAALVQEADRMGLQGDAALRHIRRRFERVALAANEMGRIGLASNPLAKQMLFLQNFQIRELGMNYYNIKDLSGMDAGLPKRLVEIGKYLAKVFGTKMATTLILARLGYSASQTLGFDPFGLTGNYTGLSDDEMNDIDRAISGGILSPFFAGGMTSLISDMYFLARKAYEDSNRETPSEEAEANLNGSYGLDLSAVFSLDNLLNLGAGFAPGSTFFNRIGQMNEMMDTGWATSATGNKMYTAPDDALNTILGYLFGRSATQNAMQYNQTYGQDLGQTLSRIIGGALGQGNRQFDPIDTKNYSDWFDGSENDAQQFEKGRRYFQEQRDRIIDAYEDAISKSYSQDDIDEAQNNMNQKLDELYDQLERFVGAYEKKNGDITGKMVMEITNLLNTERTTRGTREEREARRNEGYNRAQEEYAQRGLPAIGTYSGPTAEKPEREVKYQGSPQWQTAKGAKYDLYTEAVDVLKQADLMLQDERKKIKDAISDAYDRQDWDGLKRIQTQYLEKFDKVVGPILATYGSGVLSSTDVVEQIKDMLSTGTVSRSGDLIPSDHYRKDKSGRYRSMPLETVDVKKWAQQRFSSDIFKNPTVRSYSSAEDDIMDIKRLNAQGNTDMAIARALELKVRVDNQRRSLSKSDYQWLLDFLNNGGE